jgi:hypothetical protein
MSSGIEFVFDTLEHEHQRSTALQLPPRHRDAVRRRRRNLDEVIEELLQIADSRNDILADAAGTTAGIWYASPATHVGMS